MTVWRVGQHYYRIRQRSLKANHAELDPNTKTIWIGAHLRGRKRAEAVLHELLHAIWTEHHVRRERGEEAVILKLESGLSDVCRLNPEKAKGLFLKLSE